MSLLGLYIKSQNDIMVPKLLCPALQEPEPQGESQEDEGDDEDDDEVVDLSDSGESSVTTTAPDHDESEHVESWEQADAQTLQYDFYDPEIEDALPEVPSTQVELIDSGDEADSDLANAASGEPGPSQPSGDIGAKILEIQRKLSQAKKELTAKNLED